MRHEPHRSGFSAPARANKARFSRQTEHLDGIFEKKKKKKKSRK
jgi:hypothetical protein